MDLNKAIVVEPLPLNPTVAALHATERLNELGPGREDQSQAGALAALTAEKLVAPHQLVDRAMADCCRAALWLKHDFLDESHTISQSIATAEGSYWHGIMHRREPDYDNAKYWFHRVKRHPIFSQLAQGAAALADAGPRDAATDYLRSQQEWDPFRFVDLCQAVSRGKSSTGQLCRQIQKLEGELLFAYCYKRAVGSA